MRRCWLLLLLTCSSGVEILNNTALNIEFPLGYDPSSLQWDGSPEQSAGCSGFTQMGELLLSCSLPAGRLSVRVPRDGSYMRLRCEDVTYKCEELEEMRKDIAQYTLPDVVLKTLTLDNCALPPASLQCAVNAVRSADAGQVLKLSLYHLTSELTAQHLEGLHYIKSISIQHSSSNITSIPWDALATLPALKRLMIMNGHIQMVDTSGAPLEALTMLEFIDGNFSVVPDGAFRRTPKLQSLLLVGDKIQQIEDHAFHDLPELVNVSLPSNMLKTLPGALFAHSPLVQYVDLYGNQFTSLPEPVFHGLDNLIEINLFDNKETLRFEGAVFANLPSLQTIDMHDTEIHSLPANLFSNSTNIQKIDLCGAKLATLPDDLFLNIKLKHLDLSRNSLKALPGKLLQGQTSLVELNLSNNQLEVLPNNFFSSLKNLAILTVNENRIKVLDDAVFRGLSSLKELHLDGNQLRRLSGPTFELVPNVQVLSMSHNQLEFVRYSEVGELSSPMSGLRNLQKLQLSYNRLTEVCDDWRLLVFLQQLDLSYNLITEFSNSDFLSKATVDLRHNNITVVALRPLASDESPDQLPDFLLDDNPYTCDCQMFDFLTLSRTTYKNHVHIDDSRCAAPPDMTDRRLSDLSTDLLTCNSTPCPDDCHCLIRPSEGHRELDCNSFPDYFPNVSDYRFRGMILKFNHITELGEIPEAVTFLNMSGLNMTEPPVLLSAVDVDLSHNRLTSAPEALLQQNRSLYLAGNKLLCDCEHEGSLLILKNHMHHIRDYSELQCDGGGYVKTKDIQHLCTLQYATVISATTLALVIFVVVLTALAYKNIVYIRIILRKLGVYADQHLDQMDYDYDAFVSYAHQDEKVVVPLIKALESGSRPLKLCTHTRDWIPGELITEQISRSVERSRRTIIVLSEHFVRSYWARLEFVTAHSKDRVILLILDNIHLSEQLSSEIKGYIALTTYIHINNPYAVERLRDAVLVKSRGGRLLKSGGEGKLQQKALDVQINIDGKLVNRAAELKA